MAAAHRIERQEAIRLLAEHGDASAQRLLGGPDMSFAEAERYHAMPQPLPSVMAVSVAVALRG